MKYQVFTDKVQPAYKVALLVKANAFRKAEMYQHYITPLIVKGVDPKDIIAFSLAYNEKGKAPAKFIKQQLKNIYRACNELGIKTLLTADSNYFKVITKVKKIEPAYGYVIEAKSEDIEIKDINAILSVNYQALYYNPKLAERLTLAETTLINHLQGKPNTLGNNIIHNATYGYSVNDALTILNDLLKQPILSCDIESEGLHLSPLLSFAFAWTHHDGAAFLFHDSMVLKRALRDFFESYPGFFIFHNASFDIKQIVFNLYMNRIYSNYKEAVHGTRVLTTNIYDTKLIVYLTTNSTAGNNLSLKYNAFEFAGDYALDDDEMIKMIDVPKPKLLEYNLIDALSTNYVLDKYYSTLINDNQTHIYHGIFLPSLVPIVLMELNGLPLDMPAVKDADVRLWDEIQKHRAFFEKHPLIKRWEWEKKIENFNKATAELKTKVNPMDIYHEDFNPGSGAHLQKLLYNMLGLDVIDTTDGGAPATGAKTLRKLKFQLMRDFNITEEELTHEQAGSDWDSGDD